MSAAFDLGTIDRLLTTTRAVRKRLDLGRPVEAKVILECLRLSQQAPTGSNAQGWRWVIVSDPDKREKLAELYRRVGEPYLSAAGKQISDDDPQTRRVFESALYLMQHLAEVPVHVIPCLRGRMSDTTPVGMQAGFYGSIFPAIWSFQLALRSRGLGSTLTTLHLMQEAEAAALLGIPDDVTQVGLLPVAYTTGGDFRPAARRPVEEISYWNGWKQTDA